MNEEIKAGQWFEPHLVFSNKYQTGMTMRDYFAAKAMQPLIVSFTVQDIHWTAQQAYKIADAMLEERIKQ